MRTLDKPGHTRCLAVDSDGCVFDSMTEKHRRCFTPRLIEVWQLEPVAKLAEEIELEINLRSEHRGKNRFIALALFFETLARQTAESPSVPLPDIQPLKEWLRSAQSHSESSLAEAVASRPAPILREALEWSRRVNRDVALLPPAKPFPEAVRVLRQARDLMEIMVVSSANQEALEREWQAAGLHEMVGMTGGQEKGTKAAQLREAARLFGAGNVLMVGDAPADREAAGEAGVHFYPIQPERENESWSRLGTDILPRFAESGRVSSPRDSDL